MQPEQEKLVVFKLWVTFHLCSSSAANTPLRLGTGWRSFAFAQPTQWLPCVFPLPLLESGLATPEESEASSQLRWTMACHSEQPNTRTSVWTSISFSRSCGDFKPAGNWTLKLRAKNGEALCSVRPPCWFEVAASDSLGCTCCLRWTNKMTSKGELAKSLTRNCSLATNLYQKGTGSRSSRSAAASIAWPAWVASFQVVRCITIVTNGYLLAVPPPISRCHAASALPLCPVSTRLARLESQQSNPSTPHFLILIQSFTTFDTAP